MNKQETSFKIFTIGWEPEIIKKLVVPVAEKAGFNFILGMIGDASRIKYLKEDFPKLTFLTLSKTANAPLPTPDYKLLESLESTGVPTLKSMILGDGVLRYRSEYEAAGYATMLAQNLMAAFEDQQPDVILGSNDSIHAAISLAVAKKMNIPWVAFAFTAIPGDLTGFCRGLTPNTLLPITYPVDKELKEKAKKLIETVREKNHKALAYQAPSSFMDWVKQYVFHAKNFLKRKEQARILGIDNYTYLTSFERISDICRRSANRLTVPASYMIRKPPNSRFIYYPLHMSPESMLDTWAPFYQDQIAFVSQLVHAIPADTTLVVKLHFSDPDNYSRRALLKLMKTPGVEVAHPNASGNDFIKKAALVIGIQGTSSLEAALLGKPVLIFGDTPHVYFPRSERANNVDKLYAQINRMLSTPPPRDQEIIEAYANFMARYMPGRINQWDIPLSLVESDILVDCFTSLQTYVSNPNNRTEWFNQSPFVQQ